MAIRTEFARTRKGHIYVHHTVNEASESSDSMVVFDAHGKFVKSWGKDFKGGAHGLHILKEGKQEFLYLCDTKRGLVVKTTLAGEEVYTIGYPKQSEQYKPGADGKPVKYSPTNLAVSPNGDLYVGDGYGSSFINQYNSKGEYIRTFGGLGADRRTGVMSARNHLRFARIVAGSDCGGSRESQAAAIYAGRQAHRFCERRESSVPLQYL